MERPRASTAIGATILSVLLAGVFLAAGVPKLIGAEPLILQAAAMRGFPEWIRVVVAIVEVIGAIGLLIPATSAMAATLLALLMVPAAITQRVSGEPGILVPATLFVLLFVLAAMRRPDTVRHTWREARHAPHPVFREGVIAGVIGATAIAAWFFVVDLLAGPLFTPTTLGRAVFSMLGAVPDSESPIIHVLAYTAFHYAAFITMGIVAAAMVRLAGDEPSVLLGFVILFVAFEVGFYAFVAVLSQVSPLGQLAWWQVMVGNLIASAAMGFYLLRRHPVLHEQFRHSLDARPWRAAKE
jgi:putative oxidoreductase